MMRSTYRAVAQRVCFWRGRAGCGCLLSTSVGVDCEIVRNEAMNKGLFLSLLLSQFNQLQLHLGY